MQDAIFAVKQSSFRVGAETARFVLPVAMAIATACIGCGPEKQVLKDRAIVSGIVSLDGTPLKGGSVNFLAQDGRVNTSTSIYEGGKYSTDRAPIGPCLVSIETESLRFGNAAAYVKIPTKYNDPIKSGLTADIKPGDNENVNFALEK